MTQPGRSIGVTEWLRDLFAGVGELPLALLTQLGDVWFLFLLAGGCYVAFSTSTSPARRRRGAFVLALPIVYIVLVSAMKGAFELPRPPRAGVAPTIPWLPTFFVPVFENTATATGYGFPSGHAIGTTLVWGGVGLVLDRRPRGYRTALVAGVVGLVAFSRLALGVHYFVDVVAGTAIGLGVLFGLYWLSARGTEPGRVFVVAVAVGVVAVLTQQSFDSVIALGGAAGAALGWYGLVDNEVSFSVTRTTVALSLTVFLVTVVGFGVLYVVQPPLPLMFGVSVLAAALVVGVPDVGHRLARRVEAS
ncbi:phosphatase PAP2 family protein [Halomarina oriensis]|uniref:Phosphatase PAP2 family protein n=1 Tax=Halomarina oriensis TaxID=671145 RepID=A0A6B0GPQ8_9EURY|nr:phosphatase PAP2 family protein [Halomarina oriensis]MWG36856.1 phosphatase PAP2 family protein [Halomarina oriensis]